MKFYFLIFIFAFTFVSCSQKEKETVKSKMQDTEVKKLQVASDNKVKMPSIDCISWFDGCNNCLVKDGKVLGCTKKQCFVMEEPKCLKKK